MFEDTFSRDGAQMISEQLSVHESDSLGLLFFVYRYLSLKQFCSSLNLKNKVLFPTEQKVLLPNLLYPK